MPKPENVEPYKWQKGQSGNIAGAPKGPRLSTILREMLESNTPDEIAKAKFMQAFYSGRKKPTNGHAYAARLLKAGLIDGEGWAIKEIADRIEGKAVQGIDIGNKDGKPFEIANRVIEPGDIETTET